MHSATGSTESSAKHHAEVDFNSTHHVLTALMEALQNNFRQDMHYDSHPLISPQGNVLFTVDNELAQNIQSYITEKLVSVCGFMAEEFRFTHKTGAGSEGLQRLRLEFTEGVNRNTIQRISDATVRLEKAQTLA